MWTICKISFSGRIKGSQPSNNMQSEPQLINYSMCTMPFSMPLGWRFRPTNWELVEYYLKMKVIGAPLPCHELVMEFDVYRFHPCLLPGILSHFILLGSFVIISIKTSFFFFK